MMTLDTLRNRYQEYIPKLLHSNRSYAVLLPLVDTPNGLSLLFEVRAAGIPQGGEICFPGGRAEPEESPVNCALRETQEELGIPASSIEILGALDFVASPRGFLVHPFLGYLSSDAYQHLNISPSEVSEIFTVPLSFFENNPAEHHSYRLIPQIPEDFPLDRYGITPDYPFAQGVSDVPLWVYENRKIWGLTARILTNLFPE